MSGFAAIGGIISGGINAIMQNEANNKNERISRRTLEQQKWIAEQNFKRQDEAYKYQKALNEKTFNYQKELNDLTMAREDNAVWRRVQDLKASGLNPVLAAGSDASSASFSVSGQRTAAAPQLDSSHFGAYAERAIENSRLGLNARLGFANLMLDMFRQKADISRSEAETALLRERAKSMEQERPFHLENMELANSFLKETFDTRVQYKYSELSNSRKQELLNDKKAELLDKQIDYEDVRYLMGYADYLLKGKQMDKVDKELLVMDSLIKARQMEYDINEWNFNYFKEHGQPTTYRDPVQIKLFKELIGGGINDDMGNFFESIFNVLPDNIKNDIQRNLYNYSDKTGHSFRNFSPTRNNLKYTK